MGVVSRQAGRPAAQLKQGQQRVALCLGYAMLFYAMIVSTKGARTQTVHQTTSPLLLFRVSCSVFFTAKATSTPARRETQRYTDTDTHNTPQR